MIVVSDPTDGCRLAVLESSTLTGIRTAAAAALAADMVLESIQSARPSSAAEPKPDINSKASRRFFRWNRRGCLLSTLHARKRARRSEAG
jgi:hypothetical protein